MYSMMMIVNNTILYISNFLTEQNHQSSYHKKKDVTICDN